MYTQIQTLAVLQVVLIIHCESRVINKSEHNVNVSTTRTFLQNSKSENNLTFIDNLKNKEIFEIKLVTNNNIGEVQTNDTNLSGEKKMQKLWNLLGENHKRKRRGFFHDHHHFKTLGPVFDDSEEYESYASPHDHGHSHEVREYYYPPMPHEEETSKEEPHSETHDHSRSYPPPIHEHSHSDNDKPADGPFPPPVEEPNRSKFPPYPPHGEPETSIPEYGPYPPHHESETLEYGPYPPNSEPETPEPEYELYPPHSDVSNVPGPSHEVHNHIHHDTTESDIMPTKELLDIAEKQINQDMNTDFKPNKELLDIADKHIDETKKTEVKPKGPPSTSYGVPFTSVPQLPSDIQPPKLNAADDSKSPPRTSYGIPDAKIENNFSLKKDKKMNEESLSPSEAAIHEAKPYNLVGSSYGAPLKSVTNNFTSLPSELKPIVALPDSNTDYKFNPSKIIEKKTSELKNSKEYVMIPIDKYNELKMCLQKSLSSSFTIKVDGTPVKE